MTQPPCHKRDRKGEEVQLYIVSGCNNRLTQGFPMLETPYSLLYSQSTRTREACKLKKKEKRKNEKQGIREAKERQNIIWFQLSKDEENSMNQHRQLLTTYPSFACQNLCYPEILFPCHLEMIFARQQALSKYLACHEIEAYP